MATAACTNLGRDYYNGGWHVGGVNNTTSYAAMGDQKGVFGNGRTHIMRFRIPSVTGPTSGRKFTFNIPLVRNGTEATSQTVYYGISATGKTIGAVRPSFIVSGSWAISGLSASVQQKTLNTGSGTFNNGQNYYLWIYRDDGARMQVWNTGTHSATMTYTSTTSVGAPSSVSATTRVGRGKTASISWSGASAGSANSITGYRIYYATGGNPTTSSSYWTVSTTATSGSYTTPALTTTQGTKYYFKVRTLGSAGSSYYSGLSGSTGSTTINTTPTVSAFTVKTPIVSSSGNKSVTFNITRTDANGDTVTSTIYRVNGSTYTSLGSTTGTSINLTLSTSTLPNNSSTTGVDASYIFAVRVTDAYDTYYSERTLTITRKAQPLISSVTVTAHHSPTYRTETDNNTLPFCLSINSQASVVGASSYSWRLRTGTTPQAASTGDGVQISTASSLAAFNVAPYVTFDRYYQIGVMVGNGYENSSIEWKTSGYTAGGRTSSAFYVAPAVTIRSIGNKTASISSWDSTAQNYALANLTDFSNEISLTHTYNSLYTISYLWQKDAGDQVGIGSSTQGSYGVNLSFPSSNSHFNVTSKTTFSFFIKTEYTGMTALTTGGSPHSKVKIITNPLGEVTLRKENIGSTIKPIYTDANSLFSPVFTKFWDEGRPLLGYYNIPSNYESFSLKLVLSTGSYLIQKGDDSPPSIIGENDCSWSFYGGNAYSWDSNPLNLTFNSDYTGYLQLGITDYFNNSYIVNSSTFTLSLKEAPRFSLDTITELWYDKKDGQGFDKLTEVNSSLVINEGYAIKFLISPAITYTNTSLEYTLQIARLDTNRAPLPEEYLNFIGATGVESGKIAFQYVQSPVVSSQFLFFRVLVSDPINQQATREYVGYSLASGKLQPIPPTSLQISNGRLEKEAEDETSIIFDLFLNDVGGGDKLTSGPYSGTSFSNFLADGVVVVNLLYSYDNENFTPYLLYKKQGPSEINSIVSSSLQEEVQAIIEEDIVAPFVYIKVEVTTQVFENGSGLPIYQTVTEVLSIANVQPTVAYRKGYLGINNKTFEADDVLVISVGERGRDKIRIKSALLESTINLETMEIDGFVLNGGTWD